MMPLAWIQDAARSTAEGRWSLFGVAFANPWFLLGIPLAVVLLWRGREYRRHAAARVPAIGSGAAGARSRLVWLPAVLRILAASLVAVALSRPLEGRLSLSQESEGLDIALLLDRSSSMELRAAPQEPRRFDIVTNVIGDFAKRRMTDEEGARDNIALFGFAGFTDLLVPFTLDVAALEDVLEETDVESEQRLDGTGIGVALTRAVDILSDSDAESKVAILLTDGEETIHEIEPMDAAEVAAELGIKVYTVFAGPKIVELASPFGPRRRVRAKTGDLPAIAELTKGRFFHAENEEELEEAYRTIEELERTPRVEERFAERYDLYPFLLLPALFLQLLSWLLGATVARRLP